MARLTKEALISASDLKEKDVELPSIGGSVRVTGLSAAYANEAQSKALEMVSDGREQKAVVNTKRLEVLQVLHGLVDPKLNSEIEAEQFMKNCGPAARAVVDAIDELSAIDKDSIEEANARFQGSGESAANGRAVDTGDGDPPKPVDSKPPVPA